MASFDNRRTKISFALGFLLTVGLNNFACAGVTTAETEKYLVIATGGMTSEQDHFLMSNVEIGADQDFVSDGSPDGNQRLGSYSGNLDLRSTFITPGAFQELDNNNLGPQDQLPNSKAVLEGIDYSGNAALIGDYAKLAISNSDVNGDLGIQCASAYCFQGGDASYFSDDTDVTTGFSVGDGISENVSFSGGLGLINDLAKVRDDILALATDATWDSTYISQFVKGSRGSIEKTVLEDFTTGDDDFVVIDLDLGSDNYFLLENLDWIIESTTGLTAIFRMANGTHYDFANSSIMLSDGINTSPVNGELGAIFYQDAYKGNNQVFNLDNVILGGIGLWDFTDFNPSGNLENKDNNILLSGQASAHTDVAGSNTEIKMSNAQGCAQFISNTINMQNARWNRCRGEESPVVDVPEPSTLLLFALGLFGLRLRHKTV